MMKDLHSQQESPESENSPSFNSSEHSVESGIQVASEKLKEELLKPEAYAVWSRFLSNKITTDKHALSYRAISRAIAAAEYNNYGIENPPTRYKDRVRRALLGQQMTQETLRFFAETFSFEQESINYLRKLISHHNSLEVDATGSFAQRFSITTSFYDVFINAEGLVYKQRCSLILCALEDSSKLFWGPVGQEITSIEVEKGAELIWSPDYEQFLFKLDVPLDESECGELVYTVLFNKKPPEDKDALLAVRYNRPRTHIFFRFFFDEDADPPLTLDIYREPYGNKDPNLHVLWSKVRVHDRRASAFLDTTGREKFCFYLSEK